MGSSDVKRLKMDRNNILKDKRMFYMKRCVDKSGTYFERSDAKLVCNPTEFHRFFLIVAGVVHLSNEIAYDYKVLTFVQMIRECDIFGSFIFIDRTDHKLRCLLYTQREGFPQQKSISCKGYINSILPRYDGFNGHVIIGMIIISKSAESDRHWNRYSEPNKEDNKGFFEMIRLSQISRLLDIVGPSDDLFAIYIGRNTSLLMVDITEPFGETQRNDDKVYTLFQEGSVLAFNCKLYFSFCDTNEDQEYDGNSINKERSHLFRESTNLELLMSRDTDRHRVLFLGLNPNNTFWTLKVRRIKEGFPLECILCIPSGGQFQKILEWDEGLQLVNWYQNQEPWIEYIEPVLSGQTPKLADILRPKQSYPRRDKDNSDEDINVDKISFFEPYI